MEQTTNYYIDNRTQVVINQPTRTVMVTDGNYNALLKSYNSAISALASIQKQRAEEFGSLIEIIKNLINQNKALKAEVKELKSQNKALKKAEVKELKSRPHALPK